MSTALKCPNPSCPYLFDPSRVPAGVVLTCPRCGMQFTLGPPAPTTQAPQQPAPPPPRPATDAAFEGMSPLDPEPDDPEARPRRRSLSAAGDAGPLQTVIIAFICFVLLAGVGTMIYFKVTSKPSRLGAGVDNQLHDHNLSFEPPGAPWTVDDDTRAKLGPPMILGFKRTEPDAYIAIGARNFDTREPRLSEMRSAVDRMMERTFDEVQRTPLQNATFLGQPALVAFSFEARSKEGPNIVGLCFATSYKGIGYWYVSWCGAKDAAEQVATFEAILERLKLEKNRDNWSPKEQPVHTYGGHALSYQLLDGEDIWKEPDAKDHPATAEDPKADLLLMAKVKQKGKDFSEEATLVTMILDAGGGDALAQGRSYVEAQRTADVKAADDKLTPKFLERSGPPDGEPASNPVETPTPVVRLQMTVQGASNFSRLLVISALKIGDKVVVVYAWCSWSEREAFEAKLMQIAGSLRESR